MGLTGLAALLRYWPWAVGVIASIALAYFAWIANEWRHGYLTKADAIAQANAAQAQNAATQRAFDQYREARGRADLDRLAAGLKLNVAIQGYQDRTTILYRDVTRLIPVDGPCLPREAVRALNEGRK